MYADDQCTKSFFQPTNRGGANPPVFNAQGIEAFIIAEYDANGFMTSERQINNIINSGGGPNNTPGQGLVSTGNFKTVTIGTGPANLPGFDLNPFTTHYYVMPIGLLTSNFRMRWRWSTVHTSMESTEIQSYPRTL